MSPDALTPLIERLARARGIGDAYHSYKGELKHFTLATKAAILRAMHCRIDEASALEAQIRESEAVHPVGLLGDVVVLRAGSRVARVNTPAAEHNALLRWTVKFEGGGGTRSGEVRAWDLPERGSHQQDGKWYVLRDLPLPADLHTGYHRLEIELENAGREECALIVAPEKCREPADIAKGARLWGVAVQLYALRSENNWGIGDFSDLAELLRHAAAAGAGFVGISPVHALFPSDPTLFSPYSASSRHALNVMFIDVAAVLEVQGSRRALAIMADPGFRARLKQARAATQVDYAAVASLKMTVLQAAFERFRTEHLGRHTARAAACRAFLRERGEALRLHTLFDALDTYLRRHHGTGAGWHNWPEEYRSPGGDAVRRFAHEHADDVDFHGYLQWLAAEQLGAVRKLARELSLSVGIYGDYAVGVNASGSETWSDQSLYCTGAAIGAPPDPIGVGGQEWGIPPQDPRQLRRTAYAPFVALVRASMRACGALRLDHVMALFRQWWVPRGFKSADGGYVHYALEDLLGVVALESHRNECLVVGEDLGVVPDEIRRALPQFGVYHYKVVLFEQKGGEFVAPAAYTRHALAAVTTHDLPTIRGLWMGTDIDHQKAVGLTPNEDGLVEMRDRLAAMAGVEPGAPVERIVDAAHRLLAEAPCAIVTATLDDALLVEERPNMPGTLVATNWSLALPKPLEDVETDPMVLGVARSFAARVS